MIEYYVIMCVTNSLVKNPHLCNINLELNYLIVMNYSDTSLVVLFFVCALVWSYFMSWLYYIYGYTT